MADTSKSRWSHTPPKGIRRKLETLLNFRIHGLAEILAKVCDWLVENGVDMPDHIRPERLVEEPDRSIR